MTVETTDPQAIRNASLLLGVVNILQPVTRAHLLNEFGEKRDGELDSTLAFLIEHRLLKSLPGDSYRTTWKGQQSFWSEALARQRDIRRLWYLSDLSDGVRRNRLKKGGDS